MSLETHAMAWGKLSFVKSYEAELVEVNTLLIFCGHKTLTS
jgi:hypothetical protein